MRGQFEAPAFVLWVALTVWDRGFDTIYACQDIDFDRAHRLHSFPRPLGPGRRLRMARVNHMSHALALALLGWMRVSDLLLDKLGGGGRVLSTSHSRWRRMTSRRSTSRLLQRQRLHR